MEQRTLATLIYHQDLFPLWHKIYYRFNKIASCVDVKHFYSTQDWTLNQLSLFITCCLAFNLFWWCFCLKRHCTQRHIVLLERYLCCIVTIISSWIQGCGSSHLCNAPTKQTPTCFYVKCSYIRCSGYFYLPTLISECCFKLSSHSGNKSLGEKKWGLHSLGNWTSTHP